MKKPVSFGKYFLLERINVGGMAEVFRAKAFGVEGFERLVAVKRILPNIAEDKEFIRMFVDEAKISVQLNHANIAQIFDLGVVDTSYYIALEHIHGRDLRSVFDRCRQNGDAMPVAQACFIVMKVCEGLDYAHNKRDQSGRELNLVHRDVSPQNMLVSFEGEVKVIDFGIAKAADKQNKTQAGILKGKFGYMSPEQVRGMAIDRRSDVFSCGIVLYELLTGERLFVGESDFSTLEKVRNVEILPPSTYNRKIPDELERIVLKALAKDVDERYQNAIDLHDELQAFVYTAGEFYSRKDLAGWMKKTFGKEIDEESARIESFRQLKPPTSTQEVPVVARAATGSKPPPTPRRTQTMSSPSIPVNTTLSGTGTTKPPPMIPGVPQRTSRPSFAPTNPGLAEAAAPGNEAVTVDLTKHGTQGAANLRTLGNGIEATRVDALEGIVPAAGPSIRSAPNEGLGAGPATAPAGRQPEDLHWDDEELETQIYDNPEDDPRSARASKPVLGRAPSSPGRAPSNSSMAAVDPIAMGIQARKSVSEEIAALAGTANPTGRGWPAASASMTPSRMAAVDPPPEASATMRGIVAVKDPELERSRRGSGPISERMSSVSGLPTRESRPSSGSVAGSLGGVPFPLANESVVSGRVVADPTTLPAPSGGFDTGFGQQLIARNSRGPKTALMVGGFAVAMLAVGFVAYKAGGSKQKDSDEKTGSNSTPVTAGNAGSSTTPSGTGIPTAGSAAPPNPGPAGLENTGFDLYVAPGNIAITSWRLDGQSREVALPSRIRNVTPGPHTITIDAPAGMQSKTETVVVELNKAPKVIVTLESAEFLGVFEADPIGTQVTLLADGKRVVLGPAPATAKLDPTKAYQVLFEKPGYVAVNLPVAMIHPRSVVNVTLEKSGNAGTRTPTNTVRRPDKPPEPTIGPDTPESDPGTKPTLPRVDGQSGLIGIMSKPPCDIFIDGTPINRKTPVRDLKLPVGKHKIMLVNNEFSIRDSFVIDVKPEGNPKVLKDYSDKLSPSPSPAANSNP